MGNQATTPKVALFARLAAGAAFTILAGLLATPVYAQAEGETNNLTAGQCQAIINNSAEQYSNAAQDSPSIVQYCEQFLDDVGDDNGDGDPPDDNGDDDTPNGNGDETNGVIRDTIPDKKLPVTGGLPALGIVGFALLGAGLGVSLIRRR